jgi:hypothetical protein
MIKFSIGDRVLFKDNDGVLSSHNVYIVRLVIDDLIFLKKLNGFFIYNSYHDSRFMSLQEYRRLKLEKLNMLNNLV